MTEDLGHIHNRELREYHELMYRRERVFDDAKFIQIEIMDETPVEKVKRGNLLTLENAEKFWALYEKASKKRRSVAKSDVPHR